ncbi:MAG: DMT family transporter [Phycisphaerales bacterium]|nr:DMT family transporter [Phycisphaerales bacterium]
MAVFFEAIPRDLMGQACALLAALTWAFALVLFKLSGKQIHPFSMNLFKNALATALLCLTLLVIGEGFGTLRDYPVEDIYILIISGFLGLALADTVLFYSLNLVGVSLFAIVDCSYSPIVLLVSWLLISEELAFFHYAGGGLILFGLFIATKHPPPPDRTRGQITVGILLGILSIALMAVGIVIAKPVLDVGGFPLFWATTIRLVAGTVALAAVTMASPQRRQLWSVFRPTAVWRYIVPASIFAGYLSMVFWVGGFKYTQATIAAILNQTSVIFAILLAVLILKEKLTPRKTIAVGLAVMGVVLVTLSESVERWLM